jgi:hypothetical protein
LLITIAIRIKNSTTARVSDAKFERNLLLSIMVAVRCLSVWQIASGSLAVGNIER